MVKDSVAAITNFVTLYFVAFALNLSLNVMVTGNIVLNIVSYMAILPSLVLILSGPLRGAVRGSLVPSAGALTAKLIGVFPMFLMVFTTLVCPFCSTCDRAGGRVCCSLSRDLPRSVTGMVTGAGLGSGFNINAARVILISSSLSTGSTEGVAGRLRGISNMGCILNLRDIMNSLIPRRILPSSVADILGGSG